MSSSRTGVVVVTGGSRGIGAATARLAARHGYAVCVAFRSDAEAARAVVGEVEALGPAAVAVRADVGLEQDVERLFDTAENALGPVTALVNNAGVLERQCRVDEITADRLQRVLSTNVVGAFLCARQAVLRMSTRYGGRGGAIVNVSSAASRLGSPHEYVDYAASKGAVDTLTLGLSKEVAAEGIRVNCVRPGIIATGIHAAGGEPGRVDRIGPLQPMGRGGTAEEVAEAIVWLLSDAASYSTGAFIDVSGGR
ncbi:SDR family oxidoreductase [Streptacidiphilus sp. PB12-B1b]|uniref:SDR family oxidoreductase n=1 Tax=Streptacidiphilus sp. PB12-B1b TaxID=2705012 RepID=UPI0015F83497|nr:SDR family oxidoreductase [Streptacidiphilus sp. PB12-B1b]QMU79565.1 SDR family oxidoreductase [Streptacidiphilus sp. PB12-B1b]